MGFCCCSVFKDARSVLGGQGVQQNEGCIGELLCTLYTYIMQIVRAYAQRNTANNVLRETNFRDIVEVDGKCEHSLALFFSICLCLGGHAIWEGGWRWKENNKKRESNGHPVSVFEYPPLAFNSYIPLWMTIAWQRLFAYLHATTGIYTNTHLLFMKTFFFHSHRITRDQLIKHDGKQAALFGGNSISFFFLGVKTLSCHHFQLFICLMAERKKDIRLHIYTHIRTCWL